MSKKNSDLDYLKDEFKINTYYEDILERYLEKGDLSEKDILYGLRARTINGEIVVTSCGSAFKNIGVQLLLDSVIHFMPSPNDVPAIKFVPELLLIVKS